MFVVAIYASGKIGFFGSQKSANCSVGKYVACDDVLDIFEIKRTLKQPLINLTSGIKLSFPVPVKIDFEPKENLILSISHNGILAVCLKKNWDNFHIFDLKENRQIHTERRSPIGVGFFDDSMVILKSFEDLEVVEVEEFVNNPEKPKNKEYAPRAGSGLVDIASLNATRVLYYISDGLDLHSFNVDTRVTEAIDGNASSFSHLSMTGIDVGVKSVLNGRLRDSEDSSIFTFDNDGMISTLFTNPTKRVPVILIPSSSDPSDLGKAVMIFEDGHYNRYGSPHALFKFHVSYAPGSSLVRLFQDVFLMFDQKAKQWCLIRIVVP